ncbi:MAG: peroxidase [Solirubrobacteraceae bacterium]
MNVQGNVLRPYALPRGCFLFLRVTDPPAARRWLAALLPRVTGDATPRAALNLAFSHAGLLTLGVPAERLRGANAFAAGMQARAGLLGDEGASAPEHWRPGIAGSDVLVVLAAENAQLLDGERAAALAELVGLELCHERAAGDLGTGHEHFGFSDGFSQPAVEGSGIPPGRGEGTALRWRRWGAVAAGEFVLGEPDEGGSRAPAPEGPLGRAASYMVVRDLEQDVAAFRRYTRALAERLGREPEWAAAKLVGRWQNGSSLVGYPDAPGPDAADHLDTVNRFRYSQDPDGLQCPLGAHTRRAFPRDALGWQGRLTKRHRIVRRGMSYGEPLADGALADDGRSRGLMFVCYQASIERQFELIQRRWLGDGDSFGLGQDADPIVCGGTGMVIQGHPPAFLEPLPRFVRTRGGEYFLLPGLEGLAALARGEC